MRAQPWQAPKAWRQAAKLSTSPPEAFFTVLVVDDDPSTLRSCEGFLRSEGNFVFSASSVEDAVAKTRKFSPDLILIGCERPGLPCLELLPRLRSIQPNAAILLLADHPTAQNVVEAMKLGAVDLLQRPLDLRYLKRGIDQHKAYFK